VVPAAPRTRRLRDRVPLRDARQARKGAKEKSDWQIERMLDEVWRPHAPPRMQPAPAGLCRQTPPR